MPPPSKKIAVLRAAGLGDLVFSLPALQSLRNGYPDAEIVLVGAPWQADLLLSRPAPVDRVVPIPGGLSAVERDGGTQLDGFFEAMHTEEFDVAIQMFGGGRNSNRFIRRLGARLSIGARTGDAPALDRWIPYVYYQSEIVRCLEICSLLDVEWAKPQPELAITNSDLADVADLSLAAPLVAVHPGAGSARRRWPPARFATVADELAAEGATVVVTGSAGEKDLVAEVVQTMRCPALDLSGRLSLTALAGLYSQCALVVSNDSGPLHLANAVGAPSVGIYWCGNVINGAPLTRAEHRPAISWVLECPECGVDCTEQSCDHEVSFVKGASVEEVLNHALDLFTSFREARVDGGTRG